MRINKNQYLTGYFPINPRKRVNYTSESSQKEPFSTNYNEEFRLRIGK